MVYTSLSWPKSGQNAFRSYVPPDQKVYGCICISKSHRILLVKGRASKKWSFPKGHRERSDRSTLECALRELKEETGLNLSQDYEAVKKFKSAEYYIYHVPMEYRPFPKDTREIEDAAWFSLDQIACLPKNVDVSLYCHHMRAVNYPAAAAVTAATASVVVPDAVAAPAVFRTEDICSLAA